MNLAAQLQQEVARKTFENHFGCRPGAGYFSPGRVNLIGEHTDYNAGWVLPAAIDLGTCLVVRPATKGRVRVFSSLLASAHEIALADIATREAQGQWSDYLVGVMKEMVGHASAPAGLDILIDSNLPLGGGLSSSASIATGVAFVLNDYWQAGLTPEELASVAQQSENNFVGLACGILDPFAVAMGKSGHVLALNCGSLDFNYVPFPADSYQLVVADTGVPRRLAESKYNLRRDECESALQLVREDLPVNSLSELTMEQLTAATTLANDELASRRARHVVNENARVLAAIAALRSNDMATFGLQLAASHESLRDQYEVSCTELDIMVQLALDLPGSVGAKMTGAGFGGCVVAVVAADKVENFVAQLEKQYNASCQYEAQVYVCCPADGTSKVW